MTIESEFSCLNKKATQTGFARLAGVSQQAISKHFGKTLRPGETFAQWLINYCEDLRQGAAGRGGYDQASLTKARIKESEAKTAMNIIVYHEKIGTLVQADQAQQGLTEWSCYAVREFENTFSALVHEIESKHDLKIDEQKRKSITEPAMRRIAAYAQKIGKSLTQKMNSNKQA